MKKDDGPYLRAGAGPAKTLRVGIGFDDEGINALVLMAVRYGFPGGGVAPCRWPEAKRRSAARFAVLKMVEAELGRRFARSSVL